MSRELPERCLAFGGWQGEPLMIGTSHRWPSSLSIAETMNLWVLCSTVINLLCSHRACHTATHLSCQSLMHLENPTASFCQLLASSGYSSFMFYHNETCIANVSNDFPQVGRQLMTGLSTMASKLPKAWCLLSVEIYLVIGISGMYLVYIWYILPCTIPSKLPKAHWQTVWYDLLYLFYTKYTSGVTCLSRFSRLPGKRKLKSVQLCYGKIYFMQKIFFWCI